MFGNPRELFSRETSKANNVSATLARFGSYFRPYWPALALAVFLVVVSTWAQVTAPDLTGQLVDCYLVVPTSGSSSFDGAFGSNSTAAAVDNCWLRVERAPQGLTQTLVRTIFTLGGYAGAPEAADLTLENRLFGLGRLIMILIGMYVATSFLTGLTFFSMTWAGQRVLRNLREELFRHFHHLSLDYYAEHEAGDLMSRITNDSETIQQALNFALINVFSGALLLVWISYNMLTKSVVFALLSLIVAPIMGIATVWFSGQARKAFRKTREQMGNVNAELQESISSVREVQAFNRAEENIENFRLTNAANRDANVRAVAYTSALAPALEALGYLALAIVTVVGGLLLLRDEPLLGATVSLGLVITFLGYVQRFNQPIQQIAVLWTNLQSAIAGGERIFNLLDIKSSVEEKPQAAQMPAIEGRVVFENVCAAYKKEQPVLENVSFETRPGQTVAIVGPTGAGKTTIINLIPRFYDVCGGSVKIDGVDVRDVTLESLRSQIGIVLQDTFLFSASVLENIRFGRLDATDEEVLAAAKLAHVDTFAERLPEGYNTVLGERGSGLSQGQRQLIAIARAALANPRILILDEATSSVDTRTERLIQKALEKLLAGRTSFVIAHRLSTIRSADMLLVLDQGQVIERGKHEELLAQNGFYYRLYMSQFHRGGTETDETAHLRFDSLAGNS